MQDKHNLPNTEARDRAQLLDYLAHAFPQKPGPRGWQNPFQK